MQIRIVSMFGLSHPKSHGIWAGEVEGVTTLDDIYRYFNRVDELDRERLERIEYDLPSLSVGDLVGIKRGEYYELWRVASNGFDHVFPGMDLKARA
jgi:hypothetical protein